MYIKGKKIYKLDFIRDFGDVICTASECEICGSMTTYKVRVCFDKGDEWSNTEEIDMCQEDLILSGFFIDTDDLYNEMDYGY